MKHISIILIFLAMMNLFPAPKIRPKIICETSSVGGDADDPAIWIHPEKPELSLIAGTDKRTGIVIYNLKGKIIQRIASFGKLNNVDTAYDFKMGDKTADLFVANIRKVKYTRNVGKAMVMVINKDYYKNKKDPVKLIAGGKSENNLLSEDSYGFTLYKDSKTNKHYIFDRGRSDPFTRQYLIEYKNNDIYTSLVRTLNFKGKRAEGLAADDENNYLYIPDNSVGIYKYDAEPDKGAEKISSFNGTFRGDSEGSALYLLNDGSGYYFVVDQGDAAKKIASKLLVFSRKSNDFIKFINILDKNGKGEDLGTDGVDIASVPMGPDFPNGLLVAHNRKESNFLLYDWEDIAGKDLIIAPDKGVRQ